MSSELSIIFIMPARSAFGRWWPRCHHSGTIKIPAFLLIGQARQWPTSFVYWYPSLSNRLRLMEVCFLIALTFTEPIQLQPWKIFCLMLLFIRPRHYKFSNNGQTLCNVAWPKKAILNMRFCNETWLNIKISTKKSKLWKLKWETDSTPRSESLFRANCYCRNWLRLFT